MAFEKIKTVSRIVVPRTVRNWLRSPTKSTQWLWDDVQFKVGITKTLHLPNGRKLLCHPRAYRSAYRAQLCDPEQGDEFRDFLSRCHEGMLLFDVGANFGIFSLAAADVGGRAIAIEPSSIGVKMISAQAKLNDFTESVRVVTAAAGEAEGSLRMLSSGVFSDGYLSVVDGHHERETTVVEVTTLDVLVAKFGVPSHLKIDVEGYEEAVLRGGKRLLSESSPLIFLELHNEMVTASRGDPNFCLDELERLGYRIFTSNGYPIPKREALATPISRVLACRNL
jgi:FkbM family methyltransferase